MRKLNIFLFVILFVSFTFIPFSTQVPEPFNSVAFSESILLSEKLSYWPYSHHVEPTLAITANGTMFAGWKDAATQSGIGKRVSFTRSVNNGTIWSEPFLMPFPPGLEWKAGQSDPWLAWDEEHETLYYSYLEYEDDYFINLTGFSQITVAKSIDYGKTWNIVPATNGTGFADKETMTVSKDGTVYVVYDDVDLSSPNIDTYVRLTRSTDCGETFEEISVITDSITRPIAPFAPYVITDSHGYVYVAWMQYTANDTEGYLTWGDVYLAYSMDMGETFSEPIDINLDSENCLASGRIAGRGTFPVIHFDTHDRLYALWAGKYDTDSIAYWDVFIKYSDDYGQNWSPRYRVNPRDNWDQWHPEMTIDSFGRCHIVYYDMYETSTEFRPYYRMIEFGDNLTAAPIFHDPIPISGKYTDSYFRRPGEYFSIKLDSEERPHVVWTEATGTDRWGWLDIYYAHGLYESELPTPTTTPVTSITPTIPTSAISNTTREATPLISSTSTFDSTEITSGMTSALGFLTILLVLFCSLFLKRRTN
ncbi:MAG: exo-alpha-sialidase [Candidatus Heimdallarchaeota archaeon]|nr:MAG: exo-alpha-sialidase [Candidatus Heimdallarchaeota archaeon]